MTRKNLRNKLLLVISFSVCNSLDLVPFLTLYCGQQWNTRYQAGLTGSCKEPIFNPFFFFMRGHPGPMPPFYVFLIFFIIIILNHLPREVWLQWISCMLHLFHWTKRIPICFLILFTRWYQCHCRTLFPFRLSLMYDFHHCVIKKINCSYRKLSTSYLWIIELFQNKGTMHTFLPELTRNV